MQLTLRLDGGTRTASFEIPDAPFFARIDAPTRFSGLVSDLSGVNCSLSMPISESAATRYRAACANTLIDIIVEAFYHLSDHVNVSLRAPGIDDVLGFSRQSLQGELPGNWLRVEGLLRTVARPR